MSNDKKPDTGYGETISIQRAIPNAAMERNRTPAMPACHIGEGPRTGTHTFAKKRRTTKYIRLYCLF
jgi:hypothetical protein